MIRFIAIRKQINADDNGFAFFDTVTDSFININGDKYFINKKDYLEVIKGDEELFIRLTNLIPENF